MHHSNSAADPVQQPRTPILLRLDLKKLAGSLELQRHGRRQLDTHLPHLSVGRLCEPRASRLLTHRESGGEVPVAALDKGGKGVEDGATGGV
eukprot:5103836-Pyramimonas_sp.AAC.1